MCRMEYPCSRLPSMTLSCKTYARKRKNWNDHIQNFTEMDVFRAFGVLSEARRIPYQEDVVIPVLLFRA